MTNKELIQQKSKELEQVDLLGPLKASVELVYLSSLLSSLNAEIVDKNFAYNRKFALIMDSFGRHNVSRAKVLAQATPEWKEWNDLLAQQSALEELIRAVKHYLKAAESEFGEFTPKHG